MGKLWYPSVQCVAIIKTNFIKEREASELLNQLGIRTPLCKVSLLGDILF